MKVKKCVSEKHSLSLIGPHPQVFTFSQSQRVRFDRMADHTYLRARESKYWNSVSNDSRGGRHSTFRNSFRRNCALQRTLELLSERAQPTPPQTVDVPQRLLKRLSGDLRCAAPSFAPSLSGTVCVSFARRIERPVVGHMVSLQKQLIFKDKAPNFNSTTECCCQEQRHSK